MGTSGIPGRNADEMPERIGLAESSPTDLCGGFTIEPAAIPIHQIVQPLHSCLPRSQYHWKERPATLARRTRRFAIPAFTPPRRPRGTRCHHILLRFIVWQSYQSGGFLPACRGCPSAFFAPRSRKPPRFQPKLSNPHPSERHSKVATARQLVIIARDPTTA